MLEKFPKLIALSDEDKLRLASQLLDDVEASDDEAVEGLPVKEVRAMLVERMKYFAKNPDSTLSMEEFWAEVDKVHA